MIGLVYTDATIDKIVADDGVTYSLVEPTAFTDSSLLLNPNSAAGIKFFRSSYFISRSGNLFRFVNISVVKDDAYDIYELPTYATYEKLAFISNDDLNIVAYRSGSYQVVTVSSLITTEIIDTGALSFADMQTVVSLAATLTSPQIKYISPIRNDTITFTEL